MRPLQISAIGAILLALSVIIGAFGAHSLKDILESNERVQTYETAVQYMFIHALGVLVSGILMEILPLNRKSIRRLGFASILFILGILLFSGSLFIISVSGITLWGAIAPFGGLSFIGGWVITSIVLLGHQKNNIGL